MVRATSGVKGYSEIIALKTAGKYIIIAGESWLARLFLSSLSHIYVTFYRIFLVEYIK